MSPSSEESNAAGYISFHDALGGLMIPAVVPYSTGAATQFIPHPVAQTLPEHAYHVVNEAAVDQVLGSFALGQYDIYVCLVCGKQFASLFDARLHIHLHWGTIHPLECVQCGRKFTQKSSARRHAENRERRFRCRFCNRSYTRADYLLVHARRCAHNVN